MKYLVLIIVGFSLLLLSFQKQDDTGKAIFDNDCKSCHLPNKATEIAPSFQNIRKDYGLQWTLAFVKDSRKMMNKKDVQTLYSYYLFRKQQHVLFPLLKAKYVVKILDYVDKFSVDTSQFRHRYISYSEKTKFINQQISIDTIKQEISLADTTFLNDTIYDIPIGRGYGNPKKNIKKLNSTQ